MSTVNADFLQQVKDSAPVQVNPYEVTDELRPMMEHFDLQRNFDEMRDKGYSVLQPTPETLALADEIRDDVLRLYPRTPRLLGHPDVTHDADGRTPFERYLCEPRQAALAEFMCGAGFILSQLTASVKSAENDAKMAELSPFKTGHSPGVHADQSWMPSPFPEHNMLLTCCFVTDDGYETKEGGATEIVSTAKNSARVSPKSNQKLVRRCRVRIRSAGHPPRRTTS